VWVLIAAGMKETRKVWESLPLEMEARKKKKKEKKCGKRIRNNAADSHRGAVHSASKAKSAFTTDSSSSSLTHEG
jgi:hypothetical protein